MLEEGAVSAVEDVCFWVGKGWVSFAIDSSVVASEELGHDRCAVGRVFAVEDD